MQSCCFCHRTCRTRHQTRGDTRSSGQAGANDSPAADTEFLTEEQSADRAEHFSALMALDRYAADHPLLIGLPGQGKPRP